MGHSVKIEDKRNRLIGRKLANFRWKLAHALGEKKITQAEFGEMFGGYSGRAIASYELGDVEIPGLLLYDLWEKGHCINSFFADGDVSEMGKKEARVLYQQTTGVNLAWLDGDEKQHLLDEVERGSYHEGDADGRLSKKVTLPTPVKRKTGAHTPSKIKKR